MKHLSVAAVSALFLVGACGEKAPVETASAAAAPAAAAPAAAVQPAVQHPFSRYQTNLDQAITPETDPELLDIMCNRALKAPCGPDQWTKLKVEGFEPGGKLSDFVLAITTVRAKMDAETATGAYPETVTDKQFIEAAYWAILNRDVGPGGVDYFTAELAKMPTPDRHLVTNGSIGAPEWLMSLPPVN